jgi:hypothetical protein
MNSTHQQPKSTSSQLQIQLQIDSKTSTKTSIKSHFAFTTRKLIKTFSNFTIAIPSKTFPMKALSRGENKFNIVIDLFYTNNSVLKKRKGIKRRERSERERRKKNIIKQ